MRWPFRITRAPRALIPRDALVKGEAIAQGLYVCTRCGWAFRHFGSGQWIGAYYRKYYVWENTHDSRAEWSGCPRELTTQQLKDQYADCFGRLTFREPVLQRQWRPVA